MFTLARKYLRMCPEGEVEPTLKDALIAEGRERAQLHPQGRFSGIGRGRGHFVNRMSRQY